MATMYALFGLGYVKDSLLSQKHSKMNILITDVKGQILDMILVVLQKLANI